MLAAAALLVHIVPLPTATPLSKVKQSVSLSSSSTQRMIATVFWLAWIWVKTELLKSKEKVPTLIEVEKISEPAISTLRVMLSMDPLSRAILSSS